MDSNQQIAQTLSSVHSLLTKLVADNETLHRENAEIKEQLTRLGASTGTTLFCRRLSNKRLQFRSIFNDITNHSKGCAR
jgi:hypothetical protein